MTAPLYSVRPVTTPASARCLDGNTSYCAYREYAKSIMISTGTARKNSTITEHTPVPRGIRGQSAHAQQEAEHTRQHDGYRRGGQRALDAGQHVGLPQVAGQERLPFRGGQLALGRTVCGRPPRRSVPPRRRRSPRRRDCCAPGRAGRERRTERTAVVTAATANRLPSQPNSSPSGSVRITNPIANIPPTNNTAAVFSIISFINSAASATPIADAMVVFFVNAISTEPSGMMTARKACGSMTIRRFCPKVKPSERAASAWPSGTVFTPDANGLADERRGVDRQAEHRQPEVAVVDRRR